LIAAAFGLGFSAALFQDILILISLIAVLSILIGELIWVKIVLTRSDRFVRLRFKFASSSFEESEKLLLLPSPRTGTNFFSIYPGDARVSQLLVEKNVGGTLTLSTGSEYFKIEPNRRLENRDYRKEINVEFKTPFSGEYEIRSLKASFLGPLGLFVGTTKVPLPEALKYTVFPRTLQIALGSAKILGRGGIGGETPVGSPGIGTEFYEMREYQPGDDYRQINWKASARTGNLITNEMEKEVGGSCYLVLEAKALGDFDRDRLASSFLQIANALVLLRVKFGVCVHDGDRIKALTRIQAPEDSLAVALDYALDFTRIYPREGGRGGSLAQLPEELSSLPSYFLKVRERVLATTDNDHRANPLLSKIEASGRQNMQALLKSSEPLGSVLEMLNEANSREGRAIIYVSGLYDSLNPIVELALEARARHSCEFVLVNPTMPWVAEQTEEDALESYLQFQKKLETLRFSRVSVITGELRSIVNQIFSPGSPIASYLLPS
jgi:hypothetical protein